MSGKHKIPPIYPVEILKEEFLDEYNISQSRIAKDINVPPRRIREIVQGKRSVTANTALRLGRYFGISPQFWTNLQAHYDLEIESDKLGLQLNEDIKVFQQDTELQQV